MGYTVRRISAPVATPTAECVAAIQVDGHGEVQLWIRLNADPEGIVWSDRRKVNGIVFVCRHPGGRPGGKRC
jgi:hypothetical protein